MRARQTSDMPPCAAAYISRRGAGWRCPQVQYKGRQSAIRPPYPSHALPLARVDDTGPVRPSSGEELREWYSRSTRAERPDKQVMRLSMVSAAGLVLPLKREAISRVERIGYKRCDEPRSELGTALFHGKAQGRKYWRSSLGVHRELLAAVKQAP